MNRSKKKILLAIAFVLPFILILLFEFGSRNVYEVPLLSEEGIKDIPSECAYTYTFPYILPDTVMHRLMGTKKPELIVISFDTTSRDARQNLNRVREQFGNDNVFIREEAQTYILKKCVFLIREDNSLVLIDNTGRIRGYYNGAKREDVDRLLDEATIILKKY